MNEEKTCLICQQGVEDLQHFLLDCVGLEIVRAKYIELQRPRIEDGELLKRIILMMEESNRPPVYYVDLIWELWKERRRLIGLRESSVEWMPKL